MIRSCYCVTGSRQCWQELALHGGWWCILLCFLYRTACILFTLPEINLNCPYSFSKKIEILEKNISHAFLANVCLYLNSESTCTIQGLPN